MTADVDADVDATASGQAQLAQAKSELPMPYETSFRCLAARADACTYAPHDLFADAFYGLLFRVSQPDWVFAEMAEDLKEALRLRFNANVPCAIAFAVECETLAPSLDALDGLEVIGVEIGIGADYGFIVTVIDLGLRSWTHGLETPPWRGVFQIESHAHFVMDDRRTGSRLGSMVVMVPRPLSVSPS